MFAFTRRFGAVTALLAASLLCSAGSPGATVAAVVPVLADGIAPGVVSGSDGFGTATVLVPKGSYVTYLVRTDSRLRGHKVQIWTDTGAGWAATTTRLVSADGTVHYHARITKRTGFWAKLVDGATTSTSHARAAGVSADGTTVIRLSCDDLGPTGSAVRSIAGRTMALRVAGTVRVIMCANPAAGYAWGLVAMDTSHLIRVGHTSQRPNSATGAPGSETWSLRLTDAGIGRATFVSSQPWKGGEKAVWTLMVTVQSA